MDLLAEEARPGARRCLAGGRDPPRAPGAGRRPAAAGPLTRADAAALLTGARQALDGVPRNTTRPWPAWPAVWPRCSTSLADVAVELASYAQSVEADPARLAVVQERRSDLGWLIRLCLGSRSDGHRPHLAAVLDWAQEASGLLAELDGADDLVFRAGRRGGRAPRRRPATPWPRG